MKAKPERNANDNDARADARERAKVNALTSWRRFLRENRAGAVAAVNAAVKSMYEAKIFNHIEINQYRSQMLNGVAIPDDFRGGEFAAHSRA